MEKNKDVETNWDLCIICQAKNNENLVHPYASLKPGSKATDLYSNFSQAIQDFNLCGYLPDVFLGSITRIDNGTGIANTLNINKAKWHKSCRRQFAKDRMNRAVKRTADLPSTSTAPKYTRSHNPAKHGKEVVFETVCFICDEPESKKYPLHSVTTFDMDHKVRKWAQALQHDKILAKISAGDLIAIEAKYHKICIVSLQRQAESKLKHNDPDDQTSSLHSIVLAELIAFVEETRSTKEESSFLKLSELVTLYKKRLMSLGLENVVVHSTRLKQRILDGCPGLDEYPKGREVILAFKEDISELLEASRDDKMIQLAKVAETVRKDMLASKYTFEGSFEDNCQMKSVPASLLALIRMIIDGPSIKDQMDHENETEGEYSPRQAVLTISQLCQYNCAKRQK